ncbi:hypothetical protein FNW52_11505 [Flavobacterium sp. ZT3R18]|uniref:M949_RS01915 family surface polysaccharide biosynthesis protein n=1 Tax=Flavobacterium sp. ZT3R18 TaxID=2594429 RepID=UPI00117A124D|nr:hypothetical protein [Flavobacterium sp. ZT3R18]TRX35339.1 hypothetical protein FNW52_11505 [Flavobacterium sp. ZT3R18]
MKTKLFFTLLLFITTSIFSGYAQTSKQLSRNEIKELNFVSTKEKKLIYKAFECQDKSGVFDVILNEDQKEIHDKDTLNSSIKAICFQKSNGIVIEQWKVIDFLENREESNIWFWTKYSQFSDIDGDGLIEPIIVYGTRDLDKEFQRIKIITIYKGKKYVIRATECIFDDCRTFKKDASFTDLPKSIRLRIDVLLKKMRKEQDLILSNG